MPHFIEDIPLVVALEPRAFPEDLTFMRNHFFLLGWTRSHLLKSIKFKVLRLIASISLDDSWLIIKLQTIQQIFFQVLPANLYSHFIADVAIHDLKFVFI